MELKRRRKYRPAYPSPPVAGRGCADCAETGSVVGFVAGAVADLFLPTPFGLSALTFSLVGFAVGSVQEGLLRAAWWITPVTVFVSSAVGVILFAFIGAVVGNQDNQSRPGHRVSGGAQAPLLSASVVTSSRGLSPAAARPRRTPGEPRRGPPPPRCPRPRRGVALRRSAEPSLVPAGHRLAEPPAGRHPESDPHRPGTSLTRPHPRSSGPGARRESLRHRRHAEPDRRQDSPGDRHPAGGTARGYRGRRPPPAGRRALLTIPSGADRRGRQQGHRHPHPRAPR